MARLVGWGPHHPRLQGVGAAYDLTVLPGQEITTARGHANAFGDIGWIDFRTPAATWDDEVSSRGGFLSINHPLEGDCSWRHPLPRLPPALEMWHIGWFRALSSMAMWALWPRWRPDAVLLGGSDYHDETHAYPPGTPTASRAGYEQPTSEFLTPVLSTSSTERRRDEAHWHWAARLRSDSCCSGEDVNPPHHR